MVESSKFVTDETLIETAMKLVPAQLKPASSTVEILSDNCSTQPFDDHFTCSICTMVAWNPQQCSSCEKLNCKLCIAQWLTKQQTCPNCRSQYKEVKVARFVMNLLEGFEFKCAKLDCENKFIYKNALQHLSEHEVEKYVCVLKCSENLFSIEQMRKHLNIECEKAPLRCTRCEVVSSRSEIGTHNCELGFLAIIEKQRARIQHLEKVIEDLQQEKQQPKVSEQQQAPQVVQQAIVDKSTLQKTNRAGCPISFGTGTGANTLYCGRNLGRLAIPGSDGRCGPNNGPQCQDCKIITQQKLNKVGCPMSFGTGTGANTLYCGRNLGRQAIPGSDGRCGPNNGPQCKDCRFQIQNKNVKQECKQQ